MKIKLIRSGGLMGRTQVAEEDERVCSTSLRQHLENTFLHNTSGAPTHASGASRDAFAYFIEYRGVTLPLEAVPATPELNQLLASLKGKLHY